MAQELFTVGAGNNFHLLEEGFKDHIICYGSAGQEILRGVRIENPEPSADDEDKNGRRLYQLAFHPSTKDSAERYGPELSESGERALLSAMERWYNRCEKYRADSQALVSYTLSRLSSASKQVLLTNAGFEACKIAVDSFGLWQLVLKTHLYGSGRTKQRFLVDLVTVKQVGTHEAYMGDLRARVKLVVGAFEHSDHAGYIRTDDLVKVMYINGLDQVYFDRPINRLIEDMPKATTEEAMQMCQQYSLERGPVSVGVSTSFSGKVFVAPVDDELLAAAAVVPLGGRGKRDLGLFPSNSRFCSRCWAYGYQNEHKSDTCIYYLQRKARHDAIRASSSATSLGAHVAHTLSSDRVLVELKKLINTVGIRLRSSEWQRLQMLTI